MQQHSPALLDLDWLVRSFVRSFEFVEILKDVVDLLSRKRASAPSVSKLQPLLLSSPLFSYTYDTLASRLLLLLLAGLCRFNLGSSGSCRPGWDERRRRWRWFDLKTWFSKGGGGPCVGPHQHSGGCYPVTFPGRDILFFRQEEEERESGERGSAVTFLNSFFSALPSFLPSFLVFELLRDDRYGDWRSSDSFFFSSLFFSRWYNVYGRDSWRDLFFFLGFFGFGEEEISELELLAIGY